MLTTFVTVFTIAAIVYILLMIGLQLLLGRKHGLMTALLRVGVTVAAAILAVPVAQSMSEGLGATIGDLILSLLSGGAGSLLGTVTVGVEGMALIGRFAVAPFVFLIAFLLLRIALAIVLKIIRKALPFLQREQIKRKISLPLSAVNGLLIALFTLVPLCGLISIGGNMLGQFAEASAKCESESVDEILQIFGTNDQELAEAAESMQDNFIVTVVHGTVGRPIYAILTVGELDPALTDGETVEIDLDTELTHLGSFTVYTVDMLDALQGDEFAESDKARLTAAADSMLASDWMRHLAADLVSSLASSWLKGESLGDMDRPALDANTAPTFDSLLHVMAAETPTTLSEDLHTILEVLGDFKKSGLLADSVDPAEMIKTISASGLLEETLDTLEANDRFVPVANELRAMSIRLVSGMLGVDELRSGQHDALMGDVAGRLNNVLDLGKAEREAILAKSLNEAFDQYGYDVPENVALQLSAQMIDDLGADGEITSDELTEYLINASESGDLPVGAADIV